MALGQPVPAGDTAVVAQIGKVAPLCKCPSCYTSPWSIPPVWSRVLAFRKSSQMFMATGLLHRHITAQRRPQRPTSSSKVRDTQGANLSAKSHQKPPYARRPEMLRFEPDLSVVRVIGKPVIAELASSRRQHASASNGSSSITFFRRLRTARIHISPRRLTAGPWLIVVTTCHASCLQGGRMDSS